MSNVKVPVVNELKPRITVFGVGGAGGNAVSNMIRSNLEGVEFVIANTDAQAMSGSPVERKIQMGTTITEGLGAGSRPEVGCAAAEESLPEIIAEITEAHMVFITAGMGGGTGTGAAPVIARAARDQGILTVGVVTKPFHFEGARRMRIAEAGIQELQRYVDTLIVIPNQNLFRIANEKTTFADAFKMADEVLHSGVRGITDLMVMPGLINLDFADVRTVMNEMGKAMMGTGEAEGEARAIEAAEAAINNPLLDEVPMKGARGVLINITGGMDMTLFEVDEAANRIRGEVDPDANIIVGSTFNDGMEGTVRVSIVATGIEDADTAKVEPSQPAQQSQRSQGSRSGSGSGSRPQQPSQQQQSPLQAGPRQHQARHQQQPARQHAPEPERATRPAAKRAMAIPGSSDDVSSDAGAPPQTGGWRPKGPVMSASSVPGADVSRRGGSGHSGSRPLPDFDTPDTDADLAVDDEDNFAPPPPPPVQARPAPQPAVPQRSAPPAPEPDQRQERRRGGFLNRVTGGMGRGQEPKPKAPPQPQPAPRDQGRRSHEGSTLRATPNDQGAPNVEDRDQLEIPAFLRRQAN